VTTQLKKLLIITNIIPHYNLRFYEQVADALRDEYIVNIVADQSLGGDVFIKNTGCESFEVLDLPLSKFYFFTLRKSLIATIKKINPDKVVVYANPRDISIWLVLIYLKLIRKWVAIYGMFHRVGGMNFLTRIAYRSFSILSNKLFTYSRRGAITLDTIGVSSEKIYVIGTAIDNQNEMDCVDSESLNKFISVNNLQERLVILQVVRLSSYKKPNFIIDAAKIMCSKNNRLLFVLIGGGELYNEIKEKVLDYGLQKNVLLLGACYDKKILSLWFTVAKISIVPTCIGLSAHHSLGFGVPVMTDDSISNQASEFDILAPGLNSLIYKEGSLVDFIEKLEMFLDNVAIQKFLSEGALNTIKYNANINRKVQSFIDGLA